MNVDIEGHNEDNYVKSYELLLIIVGRYEIRILTGDLSCLPRTGSSQI